MNRALVDPIVAAVLYEGYILYPYRPSVKNRQRWTFGGLYPESYCQTRGSGEAAGNQTECLVHGNPSSTIEAAVRFLQMTARQAGEVDPAHATWGSTTEPPFRPVEALRAGGQLFHSWQEAEEREVVAEEATLRELSDRPRSVAFAFPSSRRWELVRRTAGEVAGALVREQKAVEGVMERGAIEVSEGLFRLTLRVVNRTAPAEAAHASRDEALLQSLISTHAILGVRDGEFVSLMDPPECWRQAAAECRNIGTWPVLVGVEGRKDMMLSSPIILYDYPQVAPESPGDFFDGTEIDEILTLRILTMTEQEKREMAAVDGRASALLSRVEGMARDQLLALHGTVRGLRPVSGEDAHG
jgi:hydrogenase maturation protease